MMLLALITTLIVVNGAGMVLLFLQYRGAAREREATGKAIAEIYTAADGAIRTHAALVETLTTARVQFQEDQRALHEALKAVNFLRPQLLQSLVDDLLRGGPPR